jgi:hypothetical protein
MGASDSSQADAASPRREDGLPLAAPDWVEQEDPEEIDIAQCARGFLELSQVHLADSKTGAILCRLFPLDTQKRARRACR